MNKRNITAKALLKEKEKKHLDKQTAIFRTYCDLFFKKADYSRVNHVLSKLDYNELRHEKTPCLIVMSKKPQGKNGGELLHIIS